MAKQSGIFLDVPAHGRYVCLQLLAGVEAQAIKQSLFGLSQVCEQLNIELGGELVVGLGQSTLALLSSQATPAQDDLTFPSFSEPHCAPVPSTPAALWLWLRSDDAGDVALWSQSISQALKTSFVVESVVDGFKHKEGRDLTGYIDGTENPTGEDAHAAAFVANDEHLNDSSYVAVQLWQHDMAHFKSLAQDHQDNIIGRRLSDNVEFKGSPISAHVKRTAQESFTPQAFMLRRSMPYKSELNAGLMFVCFAKSPQPFAQQLKRMVGAEDGTKDGLFEFSRPLTGAYYWCPAIRDGQLDVSML